MIQNKGEISMQGFEEAHVCKINNNIKEIISCFSSKTSFAVLERPILSIIAVSLSLQNTKRWFASLSYDSSHLPVVDLGSWSLGDRPQEKCSFFRQVLFVAYITAFKAHY